MAKRIVEFAKKLQTLFITAFLLLLQACETYESPLDKVLNNPNDSTVFQKEWTHNKLNVNKMVFKKYFLADSTISYNPSGIIWADSTSDPKKIEKFRVLFKKVNDGGYYCCPSAHYSVSFYKDKSLLGEYYVDTTVTKNLAMLYSGDHQISFDINLKEWHSLLHDK